MPNFYILDERDIWHEAAMAAAVRAGYQARRVRTGHAVPADTAPGDVGFIRPHADWRRLPDNRVDYTAMHESGMTMIQDWDQVLAYEDKSLQYRRWANWMPDTWRFINLAETMEFLAEEAPYPLVSKADVGASSVNVRILADRRAAERHVQALFGPGVPVHHGANCPKTLQKGYALLQRFIPHQVTYRVNAIGDARAIFFRYCYPDRPVAQTGNVEPAFELTPELEDLLVWSDQFFEVAGTKWCAIDVLKDGDRWRLLETSLAWPWPSPGRCNEGTIFRSGGRRWIDMFEVMFQQLEAGAWKR